MELFFFFLRVADAPNVDARAWTLCCLHSRISQYPNFSESADSVSGK